MSEQQILQEAIAACPEWLLQRISIQSRNLLALHRIQGKKVSLQTAQTLLAAQGVLVAKAIFDHAAGEAVEIEKRLTGGEITPLKALELVPDHDRDSHQGPGCHGR